MSMKFIAELCQNHNGKIDILKKMVDEAANSGATHVKIQHIYVRNLVYRPEFEHGHVRSGEIMAIHRPWHLEYKRLEGLELSDQDCISFVDHVKSVGLVPLTTCFARSDIIRIVDQGFESIKVASYDCASFAMLRELAACFDYVYVSTGATFDDEVIHSAKLLSTHAKHYSLLHCVTQYPTPLESMNLNRINWLLQFSHDVGFSDHSLVCRDGVIASKAAIVCGAQLVERHFTTLDPDETKDGPVSISKDDMRALVEFSKLSQSDQIAHLNDVHPGWKIMLGSTNRTLSGEEMLNREYYRGRFATPRNKGSHRRAEMIFNWEETPL
jgi:N,N'-diacetyllegionaminate synthase